MSSAQIWEIFQDEYLPSTAVESRWGHFELVRTQTTSDMSGEVILDAQLRVGDRIDSVQGVGNGPIDAFVDVLRRYDVEVVVHDYSEHAMSSGGDAVAAAYVECAVGGSERWGVGVDPDIATASLKAVISAVNRAYRDATAGQDSGVSEQLIAR